MKYVNCLAAALLLSSVLGVVGCAATSDRSKASSANVTIDKVTEISTVEYVPVIKLDGAGVALPYVRAENPYVLQKGKIKKEFIAKYIEATRAVKLKQYDQAEHILQTLTLEDKKLSGSWVLLGDISVEKNDYVTAVAHYQKALEINEKNTNAYLRLAKAQRMSGDFLRAQNTYAKLLFLWRDCPEAHLNLAVLYDIFLNHPLQAQKHMEAYQYLTGGENEDAAKWLVEIQQRTGVPVSLIVENKKSESKPIL
jgi:tetratricopeptide (TPR) repeat protein